MFKVLKKLYQLKVNPRLYIGLFFVSGLIMTFFAWRFTIERLEANRQLAFSQKSLLVETQIKNNAQVYLMFLQSLRALVIAHPDLTYDHFMHYLESLKPDDKLPGLYAVSFTEAVKDENLAQFTAETKSQNSDYFDFESFSVFPESQNSEHFIVKYAKSFIPGATPTRMGWDLATDIDRTRAITQARDTGEHVTTETITVYGLHGRQEPGFIVFLPVYRTPYIPQTLLERQENFLGTINSIFLTSLFDSPAFSQKMNSLGLDIEIFHSSQNGEELILDTHPELKTTTASTYVTSTILDTWGKNWIMRLASLPEFGLTKIDDRLPFLVIIGGFDLTLLLSALMWITVRDKDRLINTYRKLLHQMREHDRLHPHNGVEHFKDAK